MNLVRIAPGSGDRDLDRVGRLLFWRTRQEDQRADHQDDEDDEHNQSGHAAAFAERGSRCIAP